MDRTSRRLRGRTGFGDPSRAKQAKRNERRNEAENRCRLAPVMIFTIEYAKDVQDDGDQSSRPQAMTAFGLIPCATPAIFVCCRTHSPTITPTSGAKNRPSRNRPDQADSHTKLHPGQTRWQPPTRSNPTGGDEASGSTASGQRPRRYSMQARAPPGRTGSGSRPPEPRRFRETQPIETTKDGIDRARHGVPPPLTSRADCPRDDDQGQDRRQGGRQHDARQPAPDEVTPVLYPGSPVDAQETRHGEEAGHELQARAMARPSSGRDRRWPRSRSRRRGDTNPGWGAAIVRPRSTAAGRRGVDAHQEPRPLRAAATGRPSP